MFPNIKASLVLFLNRCHVLAALLFLVGVSSLLLAVLLFQAALLGVVAEGASQLAAEGVAALLADRVSTGDLLIFGLGVLLAKIGANGLGQEPQEEGEDPGGETKDDCDQPVDAMKAILADFHGRTSELNNDALSNANEDEHNDEHSVVKNTLEDVLVIIDDSSV